MKKNFHLGSGVKFLRDLNKYGLCGVRVAEALTDAGNESGQLFSTSLHQRKRAVARQVEGWVATSQPTTRLRIGTTTGSKKVQGIYYPPLRTHLQIYDHGSFLLLSAV